MVGLGWTAWKLIQGDPLSAIAILLLSGGLAAIFVRRFGVREVAAGESSLDDHLRTAQLTGRRLHAEAGELNPIGSLERLDDLVRRYNDWEALARFVARGSALALA